MLHDDKERYGFYNNRMGEYKKNYVREWRVHFGETLEQTAEGCGYSRQYISNIENKKRDLSNKFALAVAKHWDIAPDSLLAPPGSPKHKKATVVRMLDYIAPENYDNIMTDLEKYMDKKA